MQSKISPDLRGKTIDDVFYRLTFDSFPRQAIDETWIAADDERIGEDFYGNKLNRSGGYLEVFEKTTVDVIQCGKHPDFHSSQAEVYTSVKVRCFEIPKAPLAGLDDFIVTGALIRDIRNAPLKVDETVPVIFYEDEQNFAPTDPIIEFYAMTSRSGIPWRRDYLIEGSEKFQCPHCGHFNSLYCESCRNLNGQCVKCRKRVMAFEGDKDEKKLPRFAGKIHTMIDGSKWDGSDAMGFGVSWVVSKRFVEFLQRVHAFPFQAQPVKTYVESCDDQQLNLLESARKLKG